MGIFFEWDPKKEQSNLNKHGISFVEASSVFSDPFSITVSDPLHSNDEDRLVTLGTSHRNHVLVVVHCERGDYVRIISARKAAPRERRCYEEDE